MPNSLPDPAPPALRRGTRADPGLWRPSSTPAITRRCGDPAVYCEIWPFNTDPGAHRRLGGLTGSSCGRACQPDQGRLAARAAGGIEGGVPILGICYGMQAMCANGRRGQGSDRREFGRAFVDLVDDCVLFQGVWHKGGREQVWMSHGDRVTRLPPGFRPVAISDGAPFAAIADDTRRFTGCCSIPRWSTRRTARRCCATSPVVAGVVGHLDDGRVSRHRDRSGPRRSR